MIDLAMAELESLGDPGLRAGFARRCAADDWGAQIAPRRGDRWHSCATGAHAASHPGGARAGRRRVRPRPGYGPVAEAAVSMTPDPIEVAWVVTFLLLTVALVLGAFVAALFGWF